MDIVIFSVDKQSTREHTNEFRTCLDTGVKVNVNFTSSLYANK